MTSPKWSANEVVVVTIVVMVPEGRTSPLLVFVALFIGSE
jgi:hypothetical protein